MEKKKILWLILGSALIMTGCQSNKETNESSSSQSEKSQESNVKSTKSRQKSSSSQKSDSTKSSNSKEISSSDFKSQYPKIKKAVILAGDPQNSQYVDTLKELKKACSNLSVDLYQLNLTDETGKELQKEYHLADTYTILLDLDGQIQQIELGGGDRLTSEILEKVLKGSGV